MSAMRAALVVFLATVAIAIAAATLAFLIVYRYPDQPNRLPPAGAPARVVIAPGARFPEILDALDAAEVIGSRAAFRVYATWRGLTQSVRAGAYDLRTDMTPRQVLSRLVRGAAEPDVAVTIPEGRNIVEIADLLAAAGIGTRDALLRRMRDERFARALGVPAATLEGYLFPDSYRLRPDAPDQALRTLHARFRAVFSELEHRHAATKAALAMGDHEIVVLASIVEKETGKPSERGMVASVYLNRLRLPSFSPKLLEADPTITYGCTVAQAPSVACRRMEGRIRTAQLRDRDNPYNTYVRPGLPPGPIANPGRAALEAVFAPAQTAYLFFVSRNDGSHHFSSTLAEHRAAVDRYQRGKP